MNKKFCECCETVLIRKRYGKRLESTTAFKKRKFCSLSCSNTRKPAAKAERQRLAKETFAATPSENLEPLAYMLKVMNDPNAPADRRDRMAIAAAKFVHRRASGNSGKKDGQKAAAKKAATGRFSMG
jgi:hypothetical protein